MGLADIARAKQIQKQLDRLQSVQDAEERDRHAYKFATYQGKDPVDGTDIVEVDGVKTSGFKLMSNAPLSIGDRVNLRPNQQGLQRVDAKNVAIETTEEVIEEEVYPVKILFLKDDKIYIGGDRKSPKLIYEPPTGWTIINPNSTTDSYPIFGNAPRIAAFGKGKNDWICQFLIHENNTTNQAAIAVNSSGVLYSKTFTHTNGVLSYDAVRFAGNYGLFEFQNFYARSEYVELGYDSSGNYDGEGSYDRFGNEYTDIYDGDGNQLYNYAIIEWQSYFIDLPNDNFNNGVSIYSEILEIFPVYPTDALDLGYIDIAVFDDSSLSSLIYLEVTSNILYYGIFDSCAAMGKSYDDVLMNHRTPFTFDFYLDWYTRDNPTPVRFDANDFSFDGTSLLSEVNEYSTNQIGSKVSMVKKSTLTNKKAEAYFISLATDATLSIKKKKFNHLGLGSFTISDVCDVSISPV